MSNEFNVSILSLQEGKTYVDAEKNQYRKFGGRIEIKGPNEIQWNAASKMPSAVKEVLTTDLSPRDLYERYMGGDAHTKNKYRDKLLFTFVLKIEQLEGKLAGLEKPKTTRKKKK